MMYEVTVLFLVSVTPFVTGGALRDDDPFFGGEESAKGGASSSLGRIIVQQSLAQLDSFTPHPLERALAAEETKADWTYDVFSRSKSPKHWYSLDSSFMPCLEKDSSRQSPIALDHFRIASSNMPVLTPKYEPGQILVRNTGNYLRVVVPQGSTLMWGDKAYELVYLGVHTPAEHRLGQSGDAVPLEIQFVHKAQNDQDMAVLSVLFEEGAKSAIVEEIVSNIPEDGEKGEKLSARSIDIQSTLPLDVTQLPQGWRSTYSYFTYQGSLTTPPCREDVRWFVISKPATASRSQIEALTNLFEKKGSSARPIARKTHGRLVELKTSF